MRPLALLGCVLKVSNRTPLSMLIILGNIGISPIELMSDQASNAKYSQPNSRFRVWNWTGLACVGEATLSGASRSDPGSFAHFAPVRAPDGFESRIPTNEHSAKMPIAFYSHELDREWSSLFPKVIPLIQPTIPKNSTLRQTIYFDAESHRFRLAPPTA